MSRALAVLLATALLLGRAGAAPDDQTTLAARHALIALRVLAYDKRLAERSPGAAVTIAIVSTPTESGRAARAVLEAGFALLPKVKVGGRAVKVVTVEATSDKALTKALTDAAPSAVIVVDALGDRLSALRDVARARSVLTMSWREADVTSGVTVGIVAAREREQIVINIAAARAEGVRFGAGLLQLARIVDAGAK